MLVTGEHLPEGEASSSSRLLPMHLEHFGDLDRGGRVLEQCPKYSAVTTALVSSVMRRDHGALQRRYEEHRDFFKKGIEGKQNFIRIAENLGASLIGFEVVTDLLLENEVISDKRRQKLVADQREGLRRVRAEVIREVAAQQASNRWLERFNQLLATRQVRISKEVDNACAGLGDRDQFVPEVGFTKDSQPDRVYIFADLAVSAVLKHFPGHEIRTSTSAIGQQLEADKVLVRQGGCLTNKTRRAGGLATGCWTIVRDRLTLPGGAATTKPLGSHLAEVEASLANQQARASSTVKPEMLQAVETARQALRSVEGLTSGLEAQVDLDGANRDLEQRLEELLATLQDSPDKQALQAAHTRAQQALRAADDTMRHKVQGNDRPAATGGIDGGTTY